MVYFDSSYLTVSWDSEIDCVYVVWKAYVEGENFRYGLEQGLGLLKEKHSSKWLADLRKLRVVKLADQDWMVSEWLPRAQKAGLKWTATIMPSDILAQMSVSRVKAKAEDNGAAYFDKLEDARQWLRLAA